MQHLLGSIHAWSSGDQLTGCTPGCFSIVWIFGRLTLSIELKTVDSSDMKILMSVTTDEAGAVIGKNGLGIEAIREISKARVEVSKRKDDNERDEWTTR